MNRVVTKWFIRVNLDQTVKYIYTRLELAVVKELCIDFEVLEGIKSTCNSRVIIHDINDLTKMSKLIVACFDEVDEHLSVEK